MQLTVGTLIGFLETMPNRDAPVYYSEMIDQPAFTRVPLFQLTHDSTGEWVVLSWAEDPA